MKIKIEVLSFKTILERLLYDFTVFFHEVITVQKSIIFLQKFSDLISNTEYI